MDHEPLTRQELMAAYEHPYRRWIPAAWRYSHVQRNLALAATALAAALAAHFVDGPDGGLVMLAVAGVFLTLCWVATVTGHAAAVIGDRIRDWREDPRDELTAVRHRRPHAIDADARLAHDEFAVAVGDAGDLVTWRFRPLPASLDLPAGSRLIAGTPRYAAREVRRDPYDAVNAARAAEQLADAQQAAAELEREAIDRASRGLEQARIARELEVESRGTGAALRRITGQER